MEMISLEIHLIHQLTSGSYIIVINIRAVMLSRSSDRDLLIFVREINERNRDGEKSSVDRE